MAYRKKGANGEFYGGPMHYIREGLGGGLGKFFGGFYAVALFVLVVTDACFVQTNTLATSAQETFGIPLIVSGVVLVALSIFIIVRGGVEKIGNFCGKVVPPMCILYIVGSLVVVIANIANVPEAFGMIFKYAFAPMPAVGGFAGSTLALAMGRGASRGILNPTSFPAARSSGWPSPGHWRTARPCCWRTNPPARWTPPPAAP